MRQSYLPVYRGHLVIFYVANTFAEKLICQFYVAKENSKLLVFVHMCDVYDFEHLQLIWCNGACYAVKSK